MVSAGKGPATVKFKVDREISEDRAVEILRARLDDFPLETSEFKRGDAVRLDTGCIGVVWNVDLSEHNGETVIYIDENGDVRGPAYGFGLTKLGY